MRFAPFTIERLQVYWERLSKFPILFNRGLQTFDDFITTYISQGPDGSIKSNGLMWEVDDVGIIWLTDIYPEYQATAHIAFWDQRIRGRENLFREMLRFLFKEYEFHRIVVEVPLYARHMLGLAENVGFVLEGRLRKAAWYKDEWYDMNIYSMLREDSGKKKQPGRGLRKVWFRGALWNAILLNIVEEK